MIIAVYTGNLFAGNPQYDKNPIVEILNQLAIQESEHQFYLITDQQPPESDLFLPNFEKIITGVNSKGGFFKKFSLDIKLLKIIKKIKANVLVSVDNPCITSLPQVLIVNEGWKIKASSLKKAKVIVVSSAWHKNELIKKNKINPEKIEVITIPAIRIDKNGNNVVKEKIKANYSEGKEYFLWPEKKFNGGSFITILKAFSHFKKRQQSSMKLMLWSKPDNESRKNLTTYKYRNDVIITEKIMPTEKYKLFRTAYAVIISPTDLKPVINTLKAMQIEVPIITMHPVSKEIAGEAALFAENSKEKELSDRMIRVYTDEKLRDLLIKKGESGLNKFSIEQTVNLLWNCINKALK